MTAPAGDGKNLTIQAIAWMMAAAMLVTLVVLVVSELTVIGRTADVAERWRIYDLEAATKADALSELRAAMGFGGVIHAFRDYQIKGDEALRSKVEARLREAKANLEVYRTIAPMKADEQMAAENVGAALDGIEGNLPKVAAAHAAHRDAGEILATTDIDAKAAQAAMQQLNATLTVRRAMLTSDNEQSIAELHQIIVLTGLIQGLLILAVAGASVWLVRNRILGPLTRLGRQSAKLAEGELDTPFVWTLQDEFGRLGRILDHSRDSLKSLFAEIRHKATHDDLTGLPNRAYLLQWLREQRAGDPQGGGLALLFLDLDGFKVINDTLGHSIGDRLLQAVAERLLEYKSDDRFICRLGGDEFVLGVKQCREAGALMAAAEIEQAFTRPFTLQQMELAVSTSIGVAIDEGLSRDPLDLLRDADIALYRAKEHGQARIEVFSAELRDAILIRHRLEHDLARAIAAGEIFLVYQPIVALSDNRLIGFESLVRWRHPDLGLISPVKFIPIAEETGQILPLGRFILGEAAKASAEWRRHVPAAAALSVNVNLSPRQMWNEDYMDEIIGFLQTLPPGSLKIEVTEGMTISNPEMAEALLQRFHKIGVPLCIDDFGTGYSSLAYLHRFPFDVLKIDKSFVTGIETSPGQCRLVRGMINLAHELGMLVVAEGIETEAENRQLKALNCDFGQGYLFARPLPHDEATDYLLRQ